jgi:hypothetical protein
MQNALETKIQHIQRDHGLGFFGNKLEFSLNEYLLANLGSQFLLMFTPL